MLTIPFFVLSNKNFRRRILSSYESQSFQISNFVYTLRGAKYIVGKKTKMLWLIFAFFFHFYAPAASARRGHKVFRLFVRLSIDQVNIFVQGRISRRINGSKLIFHVSMYLYETSRNIHVQEPWPHDLYFTVHWLQTLARLSGLRFLSTVVLLMVASWYFILECTSTRPAGIYKTHGLMTYISRSAYFRLWPIFHV